MDMDFVRLPPLCAPSHCSIASFASHHAMRCERRCVITLLCGGSDTSAAPVDRTLATDLAVSGITTVEKPPTLDGEGSSLNGKLAVNNLLPSFSLSFPLLFVLSPFLSHFLSFLLFPSSGDHMPVAVNATRG